MLTFIRYGNFSSGCKVRVAAVCKRESSQLVVSDARSAPGRLLRLLQQQGSLEVASRLQPDQRSLHAEPTQTATVVPEKLAEAPPSTVPPPSLKEKPKEAPKEGEKKEAVEEPKVEPPKEEAKPEEVKERPTEVPPKEESKPPEEEKPEEVDRNERKG